MADTPTRHADPHLAHALELLAESEKLTVPGDAASLGRAAANAEGAIKVLTTFVAATPTPEARNMLGAAWMRRGIALLIFGSEKSLPDSIRSFDEAIRVRRSLLESKHPAIIHAQASSFMGRGDALARLGGETNLRQAIGSYDEAIALLRTLPYREVPQILGRLVVAASNRGAVFESFRTSDGLAQAVQAHRDVLALIRDTPLEKQPEFRLHRGAAGTNVANLLLISGNPAFNPEGAQAAASEAIEAVADLARDAPLAGEIAIKARRGLCRSIAAMIEALGPGAAAPREFLNTMTDAADEALALARHWEAKGVTDFRALAIELFGLGAGLYARHQPHFFAEYILDNLDPGQSTDAFVNCPEMHGLATALVGDALRHFERDRMITSETKDVDRQIEIMQSLRHAAERLAALKPV